MFTGVQGTAAVTYGLAKISLAALIARALSKDRGGHDGQRPEGNAQRSVNYTRNQWGLTSGSHRAPKGAVFRTYQTRAATSKDLIGNSRHGPLCYGVTPGHPRTKCQHHRKDSKNYSGFLNHTLILLSFKTFQFHTGNQRIFFN
jgi:hypothetical protein